MEGMSSEELDENSDRNNSELGGNSNKDNDDYMKTDE